MKRYPAMVLVLALLISAMASCSNDGNHSSSSTAPMNTQKSEVSATEVPDSYLATEPLPIEITTGGSGNGKAWKNRFLICEEFAELYGFAPPLPTQGPDKITTLPVYQEKFINGTTEVTEAIKNDLAEAAESFLIAAGRTDLVEAGLTPEPESLNDPVNPSFDCIYTDLTLRVLPDTITLSVSIPGLRDADKDEFLALLDENQYLSASCQIAGITDPALSYTKLYTYEGIEADKEFKVHQNSDDAQNVLQNKVFSSLFVMANYESDSVVIGVTRPNIAEYIGDYNFVPFNKALNTLRKERGVKNKDVLGYEIEYINRLSEGYYVPYYKFYFNKSAGNDAAEVMDVEPSSLQVFCEYYVRAVQDPDT